MTNAYFVVVPELVVAQDLGQAIRTVDPLADVHLFRLPEDAVAGLVSLRPVAAILHAGPTRFADSAPGRALTEAGIPLAFFGSEAEAQPGTAAVLASPFSEATVAALLQRLTGLSTNADNAG